jgi:MerR family transcriptional regulator, redox-sensitive transcriptional activator SoxR
MAAMTIGTVSRATGVAPSAIRFYESEGLLPEAGRSAGKRTFTSESIDAIRVIRMARDLGFALSDVHLLLSGFSADTPPSTRWRELADRKLAEVNAILQRATAMKGLLEKGLRCDCLSVHDCLAYDCNPPVTLSHRAKNDQRP